jgi:hypothetical protein
MNTRLIIGSLLLAASTAIFAQAPTTQDGGKSAPREGRHASRPCAQESDPAKCESRRKELREHLTQARAACKGKEGPERGQCMSAQMCAKAPDPARCAAHAKERMEHRQGKRERHGAPDAPKS